MFMIDRSAPWLVSYRRLSPQLQFSPSPAALDMYRYLYDRNGLHAKHSEEIGAVPYRYFVTSLFYLHLLYLCKISIIERAGKEVKNSLLDWREWFKLEVGMRPRQSAG